MVIFKIKLLKQSRLTSNLSDTPQSVSEAAIGPGTGQDHGQLVLAEAGAVELLGHVDGLSHHLLDGLLLCLGFFVFILDFWIICIFLSCSRVQCKPTN